LTGVNCLRTGPPDFRQTEQTVSFASYQETGNWW